AGWTTDSTRYIKIWTDPAESYRHDGKWNTSKYRLDVTAAGNNSALITVQNHVEIIGIQFNRAENSIYSHYAVSLAGVLSLDSGWTHFHQNIVKASNIHESGNNSGFRFAGVNRTHRYYNNVVFDTDSTGISDSSGQSYGYNNTVYGCAGTGITGDAGSRWINCLSYNNGTDFGGTSHGDSNYNFSKDDSAPGANSIHGDTDGKTPDFVNTGADDFHLQSTSDAIGAGTDLSGTFTDDIDGDTRSAWDIGADEYVGGAPSVKPWYYYQRNKMRRAA
ncbi:MAG: hypothetical protein JRD68_09520, partial [Deltaproteobacteria bacterium]|nr:hypothetical protein [Deltaproteobacteria bacterium]